MPLSIGSSGNRNLIPCSRSSTAPAPLSWLSPLLGGLPHHSVHHAFPAIPADRLEQATQRVDAVLARHGYPPVPCCQGYKEALMLLG